MSKDDIKFQSDYKFGFKDEDVSILKTAKGLTEETVRQISKYKNEPDWMLEFRLKSFKKFKELDQPSFGPKLDIDFDNITYYKGGIEKLTNDWNRVNCSIRNSFQDLGVIDAEKKYNDSIK